MPKQLALVTAAFATCICIGVAPAMAGNLVPEPEVGFGMAGMALVGAGYMYLKRRISRS